MIGVLPAPGDSLDAIHDAGQWERVRPEFQAYAEAFGGVRYFAYGGRPQVIALPGGQLLDVVPFRGWLTRDRVSPCVGLRVLNASGAVPAVVARARWGTPYVVQLGYDHVAIARHHRRWGRALAHAVLRRVALATAAGVIASNERLGIVARRATSAPVAVIPNGVERHRFFPASRPARTDRITVVTVARLVPEKNLLTLLRAVATVGSVVQAVTIIGEGPERRALADEARRLGLLVFLPGTLPYSLVPESLRRADLFCLPSWTEGSPKALLEAMACGLRCVASSRIPGIERMPVVAVDPARVESVAAGLRRAAADLSLGASARAYVATWHDLRATLTTEVTTTRAWLHATGVRHVAA